MKDIYLVEEILGNWPNFQIPQKSFSDDSCERLRIALLGIKNGKEVGLLDLMGLIQHVLIRKNLIENQNSRLKIPSAIGWPDKQSWIEFGIEVKMEIPQFIFIEINSFWEPEWLPLSKEYTPLKDAYLESKRRLDYKIDIDPCISENTKFKYYTSLGQQAALRFLFNSRPGSTIVFNLPTGSGKSLISWLPSILNGDEANFTLVIVPTVSLAMDQERQFQKLLRENDIPNASEPYAWFSGRTLEEKKLIKTKIINGTQKILFTSPESLIGSLTNSIYTAVAKGFLKYFIIDEAHLVAQWGVEFRPDFQAIAGLRRNLLKICDGQDQFKTLLMTATYTRETHRVIKTLFNNKNNFEIISAVHLRPEPTYWIYRANTPMDKRQKILELVKRCPRPILIYVSKREEAESLYDYFIQLDLKRIARFHGKTQPSDRNRIIKSWIENEIDLIIATSAFGVGMDKSNIRTVIHACVPESVDRFYQEVGRGGRDGKASVSFLIYEDEDINIALSLSKNTIIGDEKGLRRWKKMFVNKIPIKNKEGYIKVDLRVKPEGIFSENDANESWNMRTILLMARSGLIEIDSEAPPIVEKENCETDDDYEMRKKEIIDNYFSQCVVKVLDTKGHNDELIWSEKIEKERDIIKNENKVAFSNVKKLLSAKSELAQLLHNIYSIKELGIYPPKTCSGCPVCRENKLPKTNNLLPFISSIILPETFSEKEKFISDFGSYFGIITYSPHGNKTSEKKRWQDLVIELLKILIPKYHIREIGASSNWLKNNNYRKLYKSSFNRFLIHNDNTEDDNNQTLALPRITIIDQTSPPQALSRKMLLLNKPIHLMIIPKNTPDHHSLRLFVDTFIYHKAMENILRGIN